MRSIFTASPARLGHAGDHALVRELPQADPAEAELAEDGARAPAAVAARVAPHLEALRPALLHPEGLLGHAWLLLPSLAGEREPETAQERQALLVRPRGGRDRDVEAAHLLDRVVVDLREDDLLPDAERVVAAAVERSRIEPAEVADARQRDRDEAVEELPHLGAPERHARADRHPLADLEARDRLLRATHLRALPGDRRQLLDRRVERLRVGLRLADAHVERDLRDRRHLHDRREGELLLEPGAQLAPVELLEPRRVAVPVLVLRALSRHYLSISWPQSARRHTRRRTRSPLISFSVTPIRVGRLQTGQTSITFPTGSAAGLSITPPGMMDGPPMRLESFTGLGRVWRFTRFRFSTTTRRSRGRASMTRPCLPRSLPDRIWTRSPLRTHIVVGIREPPGRARRSS